MKIVGIIPARYGASRFPGKPLALIAGKPMIRHVIERARAASLLSEVAVATDDPRIAAAAAPFCRVEMTRSDHPSGTDRAAEAAGRLMCDAVVNIQGDEPLIAPEVIDRVAEALARTEMTTAAAPIRDPEALANPNVVKVARGADGNALYFSRAPIPYARDCGGRPPPEQLGGILFLKHIGIYGYRKETLLRLVREPPSPLERVERLEQLRALESGVPIRVEIVEWEGVSVDRPEDVRLVEERLAG